MTFLISDTNPNQDRGGTGCLVAGEQKDFDCAGRYITFPKLKVFSPLNPIATICEFHFRAVQAKLDDPKTESARVSYAKPTQPVTPLPVAAKRPKWPKRTPPEELSL